MAIHEFRKIHESKSESLESVYTKCMLHLLNKSNMLHIKEKTHHELTDLLNKGAIQNIPCYIRKDHMLCILSAIIWNICGRHEHILYKLVNLIRSVQDVSLSTSPLSRRVCRYFLVIYGNRCTKQIYYPFRSVDTLLHMLLSTGAVYRSLAEETASRNNIHRFKQKRDEGYTLRPYLPASTQRFTYEIVEEEDYFTRLMRLQIDNFQDRLHQTPEDHSTSMSVADCHSSFINYAYGLLKLRQRISCGARSKKMYFSVPLFQYTVYILATLLSYAFPTMFMCNENCANCIMCQLRQIYGNSFFGNMKNLELQYLSACNIDKLDFANSSTNKSTALNMCIAIASSDAMLFASQTMSSESDLGQCNIFNLSDSAFRRACQAKLLGSSFSNIKSSYMRRIKVLSFIFAKSILDPASKYCSPTLRKRSSSHSPLNPKKILEQPHTFKPYLNLTLCVCEYIIRHHEVGIPASVKVPLPCTRSRNRLLLEEIFVGHQKERSGKFEKGDGLYLLVHTARMCSDGAIPASVSACFEAFTSFEPTNSNSSQKLWDLFHLSPQSFPLDHPNLQRPVGTERPEFLFPLHRLRCIPRGELAFHLHRTDTYYRTDEPCDFTMCEIDIDNDLQDYLH